MLFICNRFLLLVYVEKHWNVESSHTRYYCNLLPRFSNIFENIHPNQPQCHIGLPAPQRCQLVLWWYLVCRVKFRLKLAPFCWNWDKNPTMELVFCCILNWNQNHKKMFLNTWSRFLSREVDFFLKTNK
jgi:hypothetical protein